MPTGFSLLLPQELRPNGIITSYQWAFGDGEIGVGKKVSHTYYEKGVYRVTLTVTDSSGAVGQSAMNVEALNRSPVAAFTMDRNVATPTVPVEFDASYSDDPDGYIEEWIWSFGDGEIAESEFAEHLFTSAGTYTVSLTVIDDNGAMDSTKKEIAVIGGGCCGR